MKLLYEELIYKEETIKNDISETLLSRHIGLLLSGHLPLLPVNSNLCYRALLFYRKP